jgi:hypothetical protein
MAYTINRYNGTVLTTVEDGTVNTATELKLIGKNYAGYGEAQNENYLFLLENFANSSSPTKPLSGMLWFDSGNSKLRFYDGSAWKTTGGAEVSASPPATAVEGDFWWDTTSNQLKAKNAAGEWVLIGPQSAGTGLTQMTSITLTDTLSTTHAVIAATINDDVVYIISDSEFTISAADAIDGFDIVRKGLTLVNTTAATAGVTTGDFYYWGTSSNALKLNGFAASAFVQTSNPSFENLVSFDDAGLTVGNDVDLTINIDTDNQTPVVKLERNLLRIKDSSNAIITTFESTGILPGTTNSYNLGSVSKNWATVYATTFNGTATKADQLKLGASYVSSSTSAIVNTIAARDASGDLTAVVFNGTATKARYADLAEKYSTSEELPFGTVVAVCGHEDHEVAPANRGAIAIGVVSTDPAVMMNSEAEGQYIGLKGRLPVRIIGAVKKGQAVYVDDNGCASTSINGGCIVGIALETDLNEAEKLVECVLKV